MERGNPLSTDLWRKPQTNGFHEFIVVRGRTSFRVSGRNLRVGTAQSHSYDLRFVGRFVLNGWDPAPHRDDPNLEPHRSTTTEDGRVAA